jgi:hypothetical protein
MQLLALVTHLTTAGSLLRCSICASGQVGKRGRTVIVDSLPTWKYSAAEAVEQSSGAWYRPGR